MTGKRTAGAGGTLVIKLGGELIETPEGRAAMCATIAALASTRPVAVVHGGGRAIDAELNRRGIAPRKVDGLRVTDADTLDAVVAVLAGSANTALVAALVDAGVRAVGLTGVDAGCGRANRAVPMRSTSGTLVDLGLVGDPADVDPTLLELLMTSGYVPVVASLGVEATREGTSVLNVNADVMACRVASALGADELVIAGTTPGVLDAAGRSMTRLDGPEVDALIASGTAHAGMVAKLRACQAALDDGVVTVRIVHGHDLATGTTLTKTT
jgi:acetylglutamate kinase